MRLPSWHFFIPFSPAAPVPDGYPVTRHPSSLVATDGTPYPGNDGTHIIFHQQTVATNPFPGTAAVAHVVDKRRIQLSNQSETVPDLIFDVPFTVAEVVVSREFTNGQASSELVDDGDNGNIHEAFTYAVLRLNETLSALSLIHNTVLPKVTLESLPPVLTTAVGALEPWELLDRTPPKVQPQVVQLVNENLHALAAPLPLENLDGLLGAALASVSEKAPFSAYADLRREATYYHRVTGNYRVAIILYASACESFFDELLQHFLWEDDLTPRDAAVKFSQNGKAPKQGKKFRNEGVATLVREQLVPFLTNQAKAGIPDEIQHWMDDISEVRNRVIHNGYIPTAEDVGACVDTFAELDAYIANEVFERRRDYPITALALLGQSGLESRDSWTPEFSELETRLDELYERARVFARWSMHLSAMRKDYGDFETTASPEDASSLLVFHPDTGKEAVFAVHPNGALATELPYESAVDTAQYSILRRTAHMKVSVFSAVLGDLVIPAGAKWDRLVYDIPGTPGCMFAHLKEVRGW